MPRYDDLSIRWNGHGVGFVSHGSENLERDGTARRVAGSNGGSRDREGEQNEGGSTRSAHGKPLLSICKVCKVCAEVALGQLVAPIREQAPTASAVPHTRTGRTTTPGGSARSQGSKLYRTMH